jgi:hypothetical protein
MHSRLCSSASTSATLPDRLSAGVEAGAFLRRAETLGGFGTVLNRGDAERGTLILSVTERGQHQALLERRLRLDGSYGWEVSGPTSADSLEVAQYLARARRNDPDCWILELDVPSAEQFVAETTADG